VFGRWDLGGEGRGFLSETHLCLWDLFFVGMGLGFLGSPLKPSPGPFFEFPHFMGIFVYYVVNIDFTLPIWDSQRLLLYSSRLHQPFCHSSSYNDLAPSRRHRFWRPETSRSFDSQFAITVEGSVSKMHVSFFDLLSLSILIYAFIALCRRCILSLSIHHCCRSFVLSQSMQWLSNISVNKYGDWYSAH